MNSPKKLFAIIGLLLLVLSIPLTVLLLNGNLDFRGQAANEGAAFSFDPANGEIAKGAEVEIKILINTGNKNIVGADSVITFNKDILAVIDADESKKGVQVTAGSFFEKPLILANKVEGNKIYLSINSFTPFKGAEVFGTIKFQARKSGKADLNFVNGETKITEQGTATNILSKAAKASFNVDGSTDNGTSKSASAAAKPTTSPVDVDLNNDNKVDEADVQVFSKKMGATTNFSDADFNKDGKVDQTDLKIFQDNFKSKSR